MSNIPTLTDVLNEPISFITEDVLYYYIKLESDDKYDHCMWRVNKKDLTVTYLDLVDYIVEIDEHVSIGNVNDYTDIVMRNKKQ